ncbi:MAG: hypothetical protein K6B74_01870 [Ruminococcus sp.]|nr:hypothetical protein [Ruminococcus sp.]
MRYSEAVKRHKLETKQRIFNSILEAAEKDNYASPSADNRGYRYGTEDTETKKKETITMRSTQINEVRSRKGGVIAAACAVLLIGGGLATLGKSTNIDTYDMNQKSSLASSSVSEETSSAAEQAAGNTAETASDKTESAVTLVSDSETTKKAVTDEKTTVTEPQVAVAEKETPAVSKAVSFDELLASSDSIIMGTVRDAEPQYLEMTDGSKRYVIRYTLSSEFFMYNIADNELYDYTSGEMISVFQYADEGSAPQFKTGENAIFMTAFTDIASSDVSGTTVVNGAYIADPNGTFTYSNHQPYSLTSNADVNTVMNNYMINVILYGKDSVTVTDWLMVLGENVYELQEKSPDLPENAVLYINWNNDYKYYEVTVNKTPRYENVHDQDSEVPYPITPNSSIISEKISGFDGVDLELTEVYYYAGSTKVKLNFEATPNQGYEFDPNVVYKLKHDFETSGLANISVALNADATLFEDSYFNYSNDSVIFNIVFDQAGTDGSMEFELNREFTFTLNGISASDGNDISGEYKFTYMYDPIVADLPNAKIVTPATATNKY